MAPLGLGALGSAYFANMTKYKPLFVIITAGLLYWSYTIIDKKNSSKITRMIFWVSAIISIIVIYLPNILQLIAR